MNRRNRKKTVSPRFSPLTERDIPELERMVLSLYEEDPTGQGMTAGKVRRTVAELSAHSDKGVITIMRFGETVVGYAIVVYFWSNEYGGNVATIDELYVKPQWRGTGIGSSYIRSVASLKGSGLKGIHLEVTPANRKAFEFYSSRGFRLARNRHMFKKLK